MPSPVPKLRHEPQPISLERERLRLCVYGNPGVGKTTMGATFPRPLFINTDDGLISAAIQGMGGISYEPTGWREFQALYFWCKDHSDTYDSVVFDSITTLQRLLIDEIVEATFDKKGADKPVMEFVPEQGTYLANQRQVGRILNDFRMLGKHLVVTAGVRERLGKRSPDVAPGLFAIINHWSSIIGELVVQTHVRKEDKMVELDTPMRALLTSPTSEREAKSRFSSLTPYVANPTFDEIWSRVTKQYEAASATNGKTQTK
jgi:AAA domain-containing protein